MATNTKSWNATILFAIFLGVFGVHRFYVGKIGTGFLWLFTGGLLGLGWIIDILLILTHNFTDASGNLIRP